MSISPVSRGRFQGVTQIVRFNWTFYASAILILLGTSILAWRFSLPPFVGKVLALTLGLAAFWLIASLAVAHYIYDRAGLYDGRWVKQTLGAAPRRWATFHTGLDEFSVILRELFPDSDGLIIDFFDPDEMTEPSIRRARQICGQGAQAIPAQFRALPLEDGELDSAFLFFAAHELRKPESRAQFFRELWRTLRPGGQMILLEHLRDWPNFFAFGPGCFHFHSRPSWLRAIAASNFNLENEFKLTPFVRAFYLQKPPLISA